MTSGISSPNPNQGNIQSIGSSGQPKAEGHQETSGKKVFSLKNAFSSFKAKITKEGSSFSKLKGDQQNAIIKKTVIGALIVAGGLAILAVALASVVALPVGVLGVAMIIGGGVMAGSAPQDISKMSGQNTLERLRQNQTPENLGS